MVCFRRFWVMVTASLFTHSYYGIRARRRHGFIRYAAFQVSLFHLCAGIRYPISSDRSFLLEEAIDMGTLQMGFCMNHETRYYT